MIDSDLTGANLKEAKLVGRFTREGYFSRGANLTRCILKGADLTGAACHGADIPDTDLREANLSNANLIEADLRRANLSGANLTGANLNEANLRKTILAGAIFKDAILSETKLTGVDLSQVINLSPQEVTSAIIDKKTKIPDYLEIVWIPDETHECKARS